MFSTQLGIYVQWLSDNHYFLSTSKKHKYSLKKNRNLFWIGQSQDQRILACFYNNREETVMNIRGGEKQWCNHDFCIENVNSGDGDERSSEVMNSTNNRDVDKTMETQSVQKQISNRFVQF